MSTTRGYSFFYFTPKWGDHQTGFAFDLNSSGWFRVKEYISSQELTNIGSIPIPLDPLTAVGLGIVTPEELNMPEGLRAAFNLLK